MQKFLLILGCVIIFLGIIWPWLRQSGLGNLPGDIVVKRANFTFYFPLMTCIIISVVLSLLFWFFNR